MHLHLPKPLHGWREFFGEVGIIVLGVLIALGFGQLAQSLHDRASASEARDEVRAEVRENLWWVERREAHEPCVEKTLSELGDVLTRARNGQPAPLVVGVDLPSHSKITSLRWDANAQAGRASLFSGDEQRLLANVYYSTEEFWSSQSDEEAIWAKMGFIVGLRRFTALDVHDLAILLSEARYRDFRIMLAVERAHQWAAKLHLTAANSNSVENINVSAKPVCQPATQGS
ncbi:MAG TPA: hypothetical protein VE221_03825 [Sphingomicrobium sp.]|nr:hypothetical protein [Sphingomicrobium sp.]